MPIYAGEHLSLVNSREQSYSGGGSIIVLILAYLCLRGRFIHSKGPEIKRGLFYAAGENVSWEVSRYSNM